MGEHRAGGHVLRDDGKGWVLDDAPAHPPPEERPRKPLGGTGPTVAGGWKLIPEPEPVAAPAVEPSKDDAPAKPDKPAAKKAARRKEK